MRSRRSYATRCSKHCGEAVTAEVNEPATAARRAQRIALGTAQFGFAYGITNAAGSVPADVAAAILKLAATCGVDTLDTAVAYGASESLLGSIGAGSWRIVTKLPGIPDLVSDAEAWVEAQVGDSLQRLRTARLEALLLHKSADLLGPHGESIVRSLTRLRARQWIGAIGVSVYDPAELDRLWPLWQPDIVQAPASVLDQRLLRSGWLARLQNAGTRVHLRSAFLQGLLLMQPTQRPPYFDRWSGLLNSWHAWCADHDVAPLNAALAYVCQIQGVERIVVGVDSVAHLQEVLRAACVPAAAPPAELCSHDRDLLEPSRWQVA